MKNGRLTENIDGMRSRWPGGPAPGATAACGGPGGYAGGCVGCDLTLSTVTSTFQQ
jgi:hypothetical protein